MDSFSIHHEILQNQFRAASRFPLSLEQKQAKNSLIGQAHWSDAPLGERKASGRIFAWEREKQNSALK
jgi:hypothetical protein